MEDAKRRRSAATECTKKAHEAKEKKMQEAAKAIKEHVKAQDHEKEMVKLLRQVQDEWARASEREVASNKEICIGKKKVIKEETIEITDRDEEVEAKEEVAEEEEDEWAREALGEAAGVWRCPKQEMPAACDEEAEGEEEEAGIEEAEGEEEEEEEAEEAEEKLESRRKAIDESRIQELREEAVQRDAKDLAMFLERQERHESWKRWEAQQKGQGKSATNHKGRGKSKSDVPWHMKHENQLCKWVARCRPCYNWENGRCEFLHPINGLVYGRTYWMGPKRQNWVAGVDPPW